MHGIVDADGHMLRAVQRCQGLAQLPGVRRGMPFSRAMHAARFEQAAFGRADVCKASHPAAHRNSGGAASAAWSSVCTSAAAHARPLSQALIARSFASQQAEQPMQGSRLGSKSERNELVLVSVALRVPLLARCRSKATSTCATLSNAVLHLQTSLERGSQRSHHTRGSMMTPLLPLSRVRHLPSHVSMHTCAIPMHAKSILLTVCSLPMVVASNRRAAECGRHHQAVGRGCSADCAARVPHGRPAAAVAAGEPQGVLRQGRRSRRRRA